MILEPQVEISVVIGFKDWGLERLLGSIRSIRSSLGDIPSEIIISDYGSLDPAGFREAIESAGAKYLYMETDGIWSRSRALNTGLAMASGTYLITTDADMVFSPNSFPRIYDYLRREPRSTFILQCRDLPAGITHEDINEGKLNWAEVDSKSRLRPRWGMGGLIAFHRSAYESLRGLDERMQIYGGEDIDLAKRLLRIGFKRVWINDSQVRMYHIWHESSRDSAQGTLEGALAIKTNRDIQLYDRTEIRNLRQWEGRPSVNPPLVTVAISTFNRAEYLSLAIESVLAQTFTDWELVIVNDGSTDRTAEILERFDDERIRIINQENKGLAAARNLITAHARGKYIAVHDDDDIMLPWRLEVSLEAIKDGAVGVTGGWVDFDNETGERHYYPGKQFSLASMLFSGGVYLHPTLFIERKVLEAIPYNESMRSGSDYNLGVRIARSGVKMNHTGRYVVLRRLHEGQITNLDGVLQKTSGVLTSVFARSALHSNDISQLRKLTGELEYQEGIDAKAVDGEISTFLPDHLVARRADLELSLSNESNAEERMVVGMPPTLLIRSSRNAEIAGIWNIENLKLVDYLRGYRQFFEKSNVHVSEVVSGEDSNDILDATYVGTGVENSRWHELIADNIHLFLSEEEGVYLIVAFENVEATNETLALNNISDESVVFSLELNRCSEEIKKTVILQMDTFDAAVQLEDAIHQQTNSLGTKTTIALRMKK